MPSISGFVALHPESLIPHAASALPAHPVEAVEDQVEPELELGLVVAPAQRRVRVVVDDLGHHAREMRELRRHLLRVGRWCGRVRAAAGAAGAAGAVAGGKRLLAEAERTAA